MSRPRLRLALVGLVTALVTGCSVDHGADRRPGDRVTAAEADVLAQLLHRNFGKGGADFVVTAPFGEDALLTLTGDVDFRHSVGRAEVLTTFGDGHPEDARTVYFSRNEIWFGDVVGLPAALAGDGVPGAAYLRRPLAATDGSGAPPLMDVVVGMVLHLAADTADDPRSFRNGDCTWEGQRSIDSRLASLFRLPEGPTVAVGAIDDLLTQFGATLTPEKLEVTVTLSDHGTRRIDLPPEPETADAADHPAIAMQLGI
ncbi:MAG: uncharacterized protein JWR82_1748 [Blastococcus sp.]|nr:uncharacterized protein [Blastococcus sp.]